MVDSDNTNESQIHIYWNELTVGDQDGGSEVLSYNVQWDQGLNAGNFFELVGFSTPFLLQEYTILNDV